MRACRSAHLEVVIDKPLDVCGLEARVLAHEEREVARVHGGVEQLLAVALGRNGEYGHSAADSFPHRLIARRDDDSGAFAKELLEELALLLVRFELRERTDAGKRTW